MQAMHRDPHHFRGAGHTLAIGPERLEGDVAMSLLAPLRELDATQRHTVLASFLGWTLDAFD